MGPGAKAAASGGDAVPAVGVPSDDDDLCRAHSPMSPLGPPPFRPPSFILREFVSEPLAEYSPSGRIVDTDGDELVGAGSPDVVLGGLIFAISDGKAHSNVDTTH